MSADRILAPILHRIDMMISRGVLRATSDRGGVQTMQLGLLEGEVADDVERFQSYGVSSVPPNGGDALVAFISGNRDHGVVLAVNDRGSRPKDQKAGEVILYNDKDVRVALTTDGDLVIGTKRHITLECEEDITIKSKTMAIEVEETISIKAKALEIEAEDGVDIDGDLRVDGDILATGAIIGGP
jgi:phage baseplate assembly protein V